MFILKKYGVATTIDGVPLVTRGAVDLLANPTLAAGDIQISKDGGAFANIEGADAFASYAAVVPTGGRAVQLKLHAADLQCKKLCIQLVDQTNPKAWEDSFLWVYTYGHASAAYPFDFDAALSFQSGRVDAYVGAMANSVLTNAALNADVGSTVYASNIIALALRKALDELNLDHLMKVPTAADDMTAEVPDNTVLSRAMAGGDTSAFDKVLDSMHGQGGNLDNLSYDCNQLIQCFIGITSLRDWLRLLFRKDYVSLQAKSEINETTIGTYDPTTDSLQAIRDNVPGVIADAVLDEAKGTHAGHIATLADQATLLQVKAKTDNLPSDPADQSEIEDQLADLHIPAIGPANKVLKITDIDESTPLVGVEVRAYTTEEVSGDNYVGYVSGSDGRVTVYGQYSQDLWIVPIREGKAFAKTKITLPAEA